MRCLTGTRFASGRNFCVLLAVAIAAGPMTTIARGDGLRDNVPEKVRPIPPLGIEIPDRDRKELQTQLDQLEALVRQLTARDNARTHKLLPDVQIFSKAVHDALTYNEIFDLNEIPKAKSLLKEGRERAEQLLAGKAPWETATGLVVRGYVSKIDGSVQPYGLVVPETLGVKGSAPHPLDIWFHGRNENLSELNFLAEREHSPGQFTPANTIVLHPYGRYCTAFKFAGETDVLEALASVKERYPIDENRVAVRGFSMGGAATWHFAVHYAGDWVAANPGAGFAETTEFLKVFQHEIITPTDYEQKLLHLYDSTDWAGNLFNCPTVAYSGEIDPQKQAADIMQLAMQREGLKLTYIIGPQTKHAYHPESAKIVSGLMADLVAKGRNPMSKEIHFTTYTLKYNQLDWLTVDALEEHWKQADVRAKITDSDSIEITTKNVVALTLDVPKAQFPGAAGNVTLKVDGQNITLLMQPFAASEASWNCHLRRSLGKWTLVGYATRTLQFYGELPTIPKRHNLQGPLDDAFMDSFVFVRPTGQSHNSQFANWAKSESERAIREWRRQFNGEARVKDDGEVTDADIAGANLVLWGDPTSNAVLHRIAGKLPIHWDEKEIIAGDRRFPADKHASILICPNPLNPNRYVVLNSGFTYREYDYLNNARQVAKLPDWAIVNLDTPPDSQHPGKIVAADFFDEFWKLRK